MRAVRRVDSALVAAAASLVTGLGRIPLTGVLLAAADVGGPLLRSSDALHLASALSLRGSLTPFDDQRLLGAAQEAGLVPVSPGVR